MKTVLIIGHDDLLADLVAQTLDAVGYQPVCVFSGGQGMSYIRQHKTDLVLIDSGLPGGGGMEVIRYLRGESMLGSLPVVLISGRRLRNAIKGLDTDCLPMPFTLYEIVRVVADTIGAATA
jgi:DNA-binding response OmpR family regulator